MTSSPLRIARRFNGPPDSANGGVTAGLLAKYVDAEAVQVTLRQPPPLEVDLRVEAGCLYDGDLLVAEAVPGALELAPPAAVGVDVAHEAAARFAGLLDHPFPTCFVCGTGRTDGLGLTAGPVSEGVVATEWTPHDDDPVMVWAALDCPGGWSMSIPGRPYVLGRMTGRILRLPTPGQPHVVQGWLLGNEGRKAQTGSALYDGEGTVLALAQATWIALA